MNIKQALLHNTGWRIITILFTFLNNIIIVRLLGVEVSANFFYTLAIFSFIGTILRFGLENGIVYYTSKNEQAIGAIALFVLFVTIAQTGITFFVLKYFIKVTTAYSLFWSILFVIGNVLLYYITAFYQVKRMYASINVIGTIIAFIQTICLASVYFFKHNFMLDFGLANSLSDSVLFVLSAGLFFQMVWLVIYFYKSNKFSFVRYHIESTLVKSLFNYSLVNFAGSVLMFLVMRTDFYFVDKYCDIKSLGNYVQVAKIGQMALIFPGLLGGVIFPYSVNAKDSFAEKITFFCRLLTLVFFLLFVVFLLVGNRVFVWLLGADFNLMFGGLACTYLGIYCLAMCMIFISYYEGKNKQKIILFSNLITLVLIIAGDMIFVPTHGYIAAALVFSLANLGGLMILLFYFVKKTDVTIRDVFLFTANDFAIFKFWKN